MNTIVTYDIYEVELTCRQIPDHAIKADDIYHMVMGDSTAQWDSVNSWYSEHIAAEVWEKIKRNAVTEIREDYCGDDYLFIRVMVYECTNRDEEMNPIDSYKIDYTVKAYDNKEVQDD